MRKKEFRIRVSYEINRLAEIHLSSAYKKLFPIITQQIKIDKKFHPNNENVVIKKLKEDSK